jgi:hypothetical protein
VAEVSESDRLALSAAWRTVSAREARLVEDKRSEVTEWPTPFLKRYRIYRVEHFAAHGPVLLYAGFAPGAELIVLNGNPARFVALAHADGVRIDSVELALAYVEALFETTRDLSELTYIVRSVSDVQFRAGQAPVVRSPIEAPHAALVPGGAEVTLYVMHQAVLERRRYVVAEDGSVTVHADALERDLPVAYGV